MSETEGQTEVDGPYDFLNDLKIKCSCTGCEQRKSCDLTPLDNNIKSNTEDPEKFQFL